MAKQNRRVRKRISRRRKGRKSNKLTLVNTALQPIPARYLAKHKYSTTFTLQASNLYKYMFNMNSMFDPDRSGVGAQAYGRDSLAALYNRYRVYGVTYALSFWTANDTAKVAVLPSNETITPINTSEVIENPQSKWAIQFPGGSQALIKGYVNLPKLAGRTKAQYMSDDRYQAQVNADPVEALILNIVGGNIADVGVNVQCAITMNFHVEWFDRVPLTRS